MTALRQQDHDILKAIYEDKLTLGDYAVLVGCDYATAETQLGDALRRHKTRARWSGVASRPPESSTHIANQGHHFPGLAVDTSVSAREPDFDDLDAWLYGDGT